MLYILTNIMQFCCEVMNFYVKKNIIFTNRKNNLKNDTYEKIF